MRGFNAFSVGASVIGCLSANDFSDQEAYQAPYDSWQNRIATLRFVQDIPLKPGDRGYDIVIILPIHLSLWRDADLYWMGTQRGF